MEAELSKVFWSLLYLRGAFFKWALLGAKLSKAFWVLLYLRGGLLSLDITAYSKAFMALLT